MKRRKIKRLKQTGILGLVIIAMLVVASYFVDFENIEIAFHDVQSQSEALVDTSHLEDVLKIHYIDVDQADAILITQGQNAMLIDAGEQQTANELVKYIQKNQISHLQYVVATHPHADHIGAMSTILDTFSVDKLLMSARKHTTNTYQKMLLSANKRKVEKLIPQVGDHFSLGQAVFEIVGPVSKNHESDNINNDSLVIKLTFGNQTFLFAADAEKESEQDMIEANQNLKCDILKVGHHGSQTATSDEFLEKADPSYAIISVGKENHYGLPDETVLKKLNQANIPIYRTDECGTIVVTSDGNMATFETEKGKEEEK